MKDKNLIFLSIFALAIIIAGVSLQILPSERGAFYINDALLTEGDSLSFATRDLEIKYVANVFEALPIGENLLLNPSFEVDANNDGVPDDWHPAFTPSTSRPTGTSEWIVNDAYDGVYSAKITITNVNYTAASWNSAYWYQIYNGADLKAKFKEGASYQLRVGHKETLGTAPRLQVSIHDSAWLGIRSFQFREIEESTVWATSNWYTITMPSGAEWVASEHLQIYLQMFGVGSLWVDSFEMYELGATPEQITSVETEIYHENTLVDSVLLQETSELTWTNTFSLLDDGNYTAKGFITIGAERFNVVNTALTVDTSTPPILPPELPSPPEGWTWAQIGLYASIGALVVVSIIIFKRRR